MQMSLGKSEREMFVMKNKWSNDLLEWIGTCIGWLFTLALFLLGIGACLFAIKWILTLMGVIA